MIFESQSKLIIPHLDPLRFDYAVGLPRSTHWPTQRNHAIAAQPWCSICRATEHLTVHHIQPFHLHPKLELDPENWIVLCEGPQMNCHFVFGHYRNWKNFNPDVVAHSRVLRQMFHHIQPLPQYPVSRHI